MIVYGSGTIVFVSEYEKLVIYLVKTTKGNAKVVQFEPTKIYAKSDTIDFYGVLRENRYKDKENVWKSSGLEINAINVHDEDLRLNYIAWINMELMDNDNQLTLQDN